MVSKPKKPRASRRKPAAVPSTNGDVQHDVSISCPDVQLMSQVQVEVVRWLIPGWIAYGDVSVIGGPTSVGKSTFLAGICAHACGGSQLNPSWPTHDGRAIWFGLEESAGMHQRPRLENHGVPLSKVIRGGYDSRGELVHHLALPRDMLLLESIILRYRLSLVVIDPITSYLAEGVDQSIPRDVRPVVETLIMLGQRTGAAIVFVLHDRKDASGPSISHFGGAGSWTQVPRVVLRLGHHPKSPGEYILTCEKGAIGGIPKSRVYRLEQTGGPPRMTVGAECDFRPDDLGPVQARGSERDALADAKAFLSAELAEGEKKTKDLQYAAAEAGLAWHGAVRAAKDALGVECLQKHSTGTRWWVWRLPKPTEQK